MLQAMRINLIYARAANGVIGHHNALPWHLPEDLAHFRRHTQGCPVLMGRATWDSLPERFRPLPGRVNVVLTRDTGTVADRLRQAGAVPAASLADALAHCRGLPTAPAEVWVIGGAQVYALALPLATRAMVTEIGAPFEGDAFAPTLDATWQATAREDHQSTQGWPYAFVSYERMPPAGAAATTTPTPR